MIRKSFRLFLFVFICAVVVIYLRFAYEYSDAHVDVMPKVVGSADTDSVRINFSTVDTTHYPVVLDADSLIILVYPPDNAAPESTADGGTGVFNLTTGYYQYHRRGSNATPDLGVYTVCVKAWRGEAVSGIGNCAYLVTPAGTYHYGVQDSIRDLADSSAKAIEDANKANFKSTGFATSAQGDSATQAIADANKPNFRATGFATAGSVHTAIADVNKANFKSTGFATHSAADVKTLWGDTLAYLIAFRDSVNNAVADANKSNFKSTGFAVAGDAMTLQDDSLNTLMQNVVNLVHFYGACDDCYEIHFPPDGTPNKDSSYLVNPNLAGGDTLVAKVEFRHSNVPWVADSSYYYLNPWW